jgi:hypothetical protein
LFVRSCVRVQKEQEGETGGAAHVPVLNLPRLHYFPALSPARAPSGAAAGAAAAAAAAAPGSETARCK